MKKMFLKKHFLTVLTFFVVSAKLAVGISTMKPIKAYLNASDQDLHKLDANELTGRLRDGGSGSGGNTMFGFNNFLQNYLIASLLQQSSMGVAAGHGGGAAAGGSGGAAAGNGGGAGPSASSGAAAAHSSAVVMAESDGEFMGSSDVVSASGTAMSSISAHASQSASRPPASHPISVATLMLMMPMFAHSSSGFGCGSGEWDGD